MFPDPGRANTFRVATVDAVQDHYCVRPVGTGFLLSCDLHKDFKQFRMFMTNEHVLEEAMKTAGQLGVIRDDGLWFPVFQVYFNKPSDLAILLTKELFSALAGLVFDNTHFTAGTQVHTWGFPSPYPGSNPLLAVGHVAGSQGSDLYVNMAVNPGNSGGAVLSANGSISAVVRAKYLAGYSEITTDLSCLSGVQGLMQLSVGEHSVDVGAVIRRAITYTRDTSQLVIGIGVPAAVAQAVIADFLLVAPGDQ